jgi:hypothetical protein
VIENYIGENILSAQGDGGLQRSLACACNLKLNWDLVYVNSIALGVLVSKFYTAVFVLFVLAMFQNCANPQGYLAFNQASSSSSSGGASTKSGVQITNLEEEVPKSSDSNVLIEVRVSGYYMAPGSATAYGVRLLSDGRVIRFSQNNSLPPSELNKDNEYITEVAKLSSSLMALELERIAKASSEGSPLSPTYEPGELPLCAPDMGQKVFTIAPNSKSSKVIAIDASCGDERLPIGESVPLVAHLRALLQLGL